MQTKSAKKTLLISLLVSGIIITLASAHQGELPKPRRYIGLGATFFLAALLLEAMPALGAGFAVLIAVAMLLKNGEGALNALLGASDATRKFATARQSVVPAALSFGVFGSVPTGEWGSAKETVQSLTNPVKSRVRVVSAKRAIKNTSTGGISDHWTGCKQCYAEDLSGSVAAMDYAAVYICRALGKSYDGKTPLVFTTERGGYRIQILYRTLVGGNHFTHVHVGARKDGYTP